MQKNFISLRKNIIICKNKIVEQYDEHYKICIFICEMRGGKTKHMHGIVKSVYYGEIQECAQWSWPRYFMVEMS